MTYSDLLVPALPHRRRLLLLAFVIVALRPQVGAGQQSYPDGLFAEITTPKGVIVLSLDFQHTPMTVASFVGLAEGTVDNAAFAPGRPFFDGSRFQRVVPGHVIQGGGPDSEQSSAAGYRIPNEIDPRLGHGRAGMLAMANGGPHTASNQFYITLGDRSYLDGDYTVFGEVHSGLDVVRRIEANDGMERVRIVRVGAAAEAFRPTTESLAESISAVWEAVARADAEKSRQDEEYVTSRWPQAQRVTDAWSYTVLEEGSGDLEAGASIRLRYTGRSPQGLAFASTTDGCAPWFQESADGGDPCVYVVGESSLNPGFDEAVARMRRGARWIVAVNPDAAYGVRGYYPPERAGQPRFHVSPHTLLIYDVEVLR